MNDQAQDSQNIPDEIEVDTDADFGGDDVIIPGSPPPLSPGRTDVNPDDEPGVDELPGNEGKIPSGSDDAGLDPDMADIDVDNAEMDGQPNPR